MVSGKLYIMVLLLLMAFMEISVATDVFPNFNGSVRNLYNNSFDELFHIDSDVPVYPPPPNINMNDFNDISNMGIGNDNFNYTWKWDSNISDQLKDINKILDLNDLYDNNNNDLYDNNNNDINNVDYTPSDYTPTYRTTYYPRGGHIIFIPVGAIIFLISVCLRFCLCNNRRVTVTRRVIIRRPLGAAGYPVQVQNSSNSDFVPVNEPTPVNPADQPPAYTDIEMPPPDYSEIEKEKDIFRSNNSSSADLPSYDASQQLKEQSASATNMSSNLSTTINMSGDDEVESLSTPLDVSNDQEESQVMSSRPSATSLSRALKSSSKSLKSQFAFKKMDEEE